MPQGLGAQKHKNQKVLTKRRNSAEQIFFSDNKIEEVGELISIETS